MKTKHYILLLFSFFVLFSNCKKDENIVPDYSYKIDSESKDGVVIKFTNTTSIDGTAKGYTWDFGDNSIVGDNNYANSPTHLYEIGGTVSVTLTVEGSNSTEKITKSVIIPAMKGDFDAVIHDLNIVTITNKSTNYGSEDTKFYWQMGDGEIITTQDPTFEYEYSKAGDYKINLRIERGNERATATKTITVSNFTVDFIIHQISLSQIEIQDNTQNVFGSETTLHIDFGDGTYYDVAYDFVPDKIPKEYETSGNYQITYTIERGTEKGTKIKTIAISDFFVDFNLSTTNQINVFGITDNSEDLFGEYLVSIDFGDGSDIVTYENINYGEYTKTYQHAGNYLINYTIKRDAEVGYATKSIYIPDLLAKFSLVPGSAINIFNVSDISENLFGNEEITIDFGDGTDPVEFATTNYPTYEKTYANGGNFNITYTINRGVELSSAVRTVSIDALVADFNIVAGADINIFGITDNSSNLTGSETVSIDFGDGTDIVEFDNTAYPTYEKTYDNPGSYNIIYSVSRGDETATKIKNVTIGSTNLIADFNMVEGASINIFNISDNSSNLLGTETVTIDFGDGTDLVEFSATNYPAFDKTYSNGGNYNIVYTLNRGEVSATAIKSVSLPTLSANFTYTQTGNFTYDFSVIDNQSFGDITYFWDFGDGNTSTQHDITHTFANGGSHNVSLTVTRGTEFSQITKTVSIALLFVNYNFEVNMIDLETVTFTDISTNYSDDATVNWDFGDGETLTYIVSDGWQEIIEHTYSRPDDYNVILEYTQGEEHEIKSKTVSIPALNQNLGINVDDGATELDKNFNIINTDNIINATVTWDFDDGTTETYIIPDDQTVDYIVPHSYSTGGNYWVTLTVEQGTETIYANAMVSVVQTPAMNPQFTYNTNTLIQGETILFTNTSTNIPGGATIEWLIVPNGANDITTTEDGDNIEVLFKKDQSYTIALKYTHGIDTETSNTENLTFATLTALFEQSNYTWNGGSSTADIDFDFSTIKPDNADGATFAWALYDNVDTEIQTGTGFTFAATDVAPGTGYYVEVTRTYGGVDSPTENKAFSIDAGGIFSWD